MNEILIINIQTMEIKTVINFKYTLNINTIYRKSWYKTVYKYTPMIINLSLDYTNNN